jgi:predicted nuclease of restriction endonuclease-like (RecB) superfamily
MKKEQRRTTAAPRKATAKAPQPEAGRLLGDIRVLIELARGRVAMVANSELVMLYWYIGHRIRQDILKEERAEYGQQLIMELARQLTTKFRSGFAEKSLRRMIQFAEVFPDEKIVAALSRQLGWSHFVALIPLKNDLQRDFYAEMCRIERWSIRTLRAKIGGMLFERTAISGKPAQLIRQELDLLHDEDRMTPDLVFRDPYLLDFLGLWDTYSEKDLEMAILREMERFILELGLGLSFVARQKRLSVDNEDYYLDLLFYHRKMRRLVAIDLKLGNFQAADKGQMELYLRWLEKYDREPGEESPLGLILCAGKSREHVELLQLEQSGIRVAEYLTELPPREVLERKLHEAILYARECLARQRLDIAETTDSEGK